MARINKSRFAILGFLSKGDHSGYDMKRLVEKISRFYWTESNAQLYPILKQLEQEKLVSSKLDKKSGARARRVYTLTEKGAQALRAWLLEPVETPKYREELFLKLSCAQHLPLSALIRHIESYREEIAEKQRYLGIIEDHIAHAHTGKPEQPYLQLVYRYYRLTFAAAIEWSDETLLQLKRMASTKNAGRSRAQR